MNQPVESLLPGGIKVTEVTDAVEWDALVNEHHGHPLQLWGWGELKGSGAWTPRRLVIEGPFGSAVAQVLVRRLPIPFRAFSYVPRGPAICFAKAKDAKTRVAVLRTIVNWCRKNVGGVAIEFEPEWPEGTALPGLNPKIARNPILHAHTIILDLTWKSEELLKVMRKSTRYEIRRAERDGIEVRRITEVPEILKVLEVYEETAKRAGFALHDAAYYLAISEYLGENSRLFAAIDHDGNPCAFAWSIVSADTGFLLYGGQNEIGKNLKANAAVYWAAISDAKALGCRRYDLNGLLGEGITKFKKSFASHEDILIGTLDIPINRILYAGWERAIPLAKQALRSFRSKLN